MIYRHKKTGVLYRVIDHGIDEKTGQTVVIYKDSSRIWVRTAKEFYDGRFEVLLVPHEEVADDTEV